MKYCITRKRKPITTEELEQAFQTFAYKSANKGGKERGEIHLSRQELANVLEILGTRLSADEMDEMMIEADIDNTGFIEFYGKMLCATTQIIADKT